MIICGDSLEVLRSDGLIKWPVKCIFADIPDNIGQAYSGYDDNRRDADYYDWVRLLVMESLVRCSVHWLCFNPRHMMEINYIIRDIVRYRHPSWEYRMIIWRYTFSQYNDTDCAYGYRPLIRLKRRDAKMYPDAIREISIRQQLGDSRAQEGGRVPDDVWPIPRVVGNSAERVATMPNQLPVRLMERVIAFSCDPTAGEIFVDLCAGSGSALIAGRNLKFPDGSVIGIDIDLATCISIEERTKIRFNPRVS